MFDRQNVAGGEDLLASDWRFKATARALAACSTAARAGLIGAFSSIGGLQCGPIGGVYWRAFGINIVLIRQRPVRWLEIILRNGLKGRLAAPSIVGRAMPPGQENRMKIGRASCRERVSSPV